MVRFNAVQRLVYGLLRGKAINLASTHRIESPRGLS